ncbi:hypothetical protein E3N88_43988 [Mikania micrantha]|uniref:Uncharacterized protein n=1 Tax=Mikania micrantha TaxID=192012 RepID=A0A5N6LDW3_9ASTR|nr:hypothetical protein E3N88_43988 [Mikania micrantha]
MSDEGVRSNGAWYWANEPRPNVLLRPYESFDSLTFGGLFPATPPMANFVLGHALCCSSPLPRFSVEFGLDPLYFHVEDVEGYAWAKESLKLVKKRERYGALKVSHGGGCSWPEKREKREVGGD